MRNEGSARRMTWPDRGLSSTADSAEGIGRSDDNREF